MARPSDYSLEIATEICTRISEGEPLKIIWRVALAERLVCWFLELCGPGSGAGSEAIKPLPQVATAPSVLASGKCLWPPALRAPDRHCGKYSYARFELHIMRAPYAASWPLHLILQQPQFGPANISDGVFNGKDMGVQR